MASSSTARNASAEELACDDGASSRGKVGRHCWMIVVRPSRQTREWPGGSARTDLNGVRGGKMVQNVTLAFLFNGIGIPLAATGLIHPIWAMVAMAVSVTAIFCNSLWGTPRLFFDAIRSVGQPVAVAAPA